jgi:antitoxin (DNA-binding transcriptional repressor) of toxin-antitoxin stability system
MTITVIITEASQQFSQLIGQVLIDEEMIICKNGIAFAIISPSKKKHQPQVAG